MRKFLIIVVVMMKIPLLGMSSTPWLTEGAVEFLECFFQEHDNPKVLEFGSGGSTIWMAKRTKNLYSVEHHRKWYKSVVEVIEKDPECHRVKCFFRDRPYYSICHEFKDETFDLILVDGRNRKGCIVNAIPKLKPGGVLILDDAERERYQAAIVLMESWETGSYVIKIHNYLVDPNKTTQYWIKPLKDDR